MHSESNETNFNNVLINFLRPKLCPKVTCDSFCLDGYEAENLLSDNSLIKSRGFLAGMSKTPPVSLEFEFLCNVNMNYIKMNTTVGEQRCTGIEIFSKSDRNSPYVSIGKSIYDKRGLIFCNGRFYKRGHLIFEGEEDKEICYFKSNAFRFFLNAAFLKILIFKTPNKSPCMGSVEVWGLPSRSCSKVTIETVNKLAKECQYSLENAQMISHRHNTDAKSEEQDEFAIPPDFKDDLTYEIMTLPMTLPSGKTIDQTTLEKHIESEKSFGRKPGDPFTGKGFTDACKPILNIALKSRIDMFLTHNSHRNETYNLARISGTTNYSSYFRDTLSKETSTCSKRKLSDSELKGEGSSHSRNVVSKEQCYSCDNTDNLYVISLCNHIYCRMCIMKICDTLECPNCKTIFNRENIIKYNLFKSNYDICDKSQCS